MQDLDEIIYNALTADTALMTEVGNRVQSTSFEVSPEEKDNTPLPYIIVTNDGFQNNLGTKDSVWEGPQDQVQATVEVAGRSPNEVRNMARKVRKAIQRFIPVLYREQGVVPELDNLQSNGIQWDWMKPCYYTHLTYQCLIDNEVYEQEEE